MKKIYIYSIVVALMGFSINSCTDFTEEDAKGVLTPDNYFKNEQEVILGLNGLHADVVGSGELLSLMGTDQGVCGRDPIAAGWLSAVYNYGVDNASVRNLWLSGYASVKNANFLIDALETSSVSAEVKANARAQALFYRALFYFDLTTVYGDIPYWRDALDIEKVSLLGKTSASIIQEDMIADLDEVIKSGNLATVRWNQNKSRPTVWAARMLKAQYHIWLKQWDKARTELIEVTYNSPHILNADYADMYRQGKELNNEIIFGREYLAGVQDNKKFEQSHFNSASENANTKTAMSQTGVFTRTASLTVRKSFANTYNINDKRKKYNVWDSHKLTNGTVAVFNFIYIPKLMRAKLPISDPLMQTADIIGTSSEPSRVFVLSDAWLLLAEAEFMLDGSTTAALNAINKIRSVERTGLTPYTSITIEDIRKERGWELLGEGFFGRKKDLIRWGILEPTIIALPAAETAVGAYSLAITRAQEEAAFIQNAPEGKFRNYPIPVEELLNSQNVGGKLEQNPLWK